MGGRLYDWLGSGVAADLPPAAGMAALLGSAGSTALYFETDTKLLDIYDDSGPSWFQIDAASLAAIAFSTLPDVDWSTPPLHGQAFAWDTGSTKLVPVTLATQYSDELAQDALAAAFAAGTHTGITVTYGDGANKFDFVNTVTQYTDAMAIAAVGPIPTQYTDELAQDALAAAFAAGSHTGITVTYGDGANKFDLACTVTQYTDEMAMDALAAAFAAGTHTNFTVTYNDASNKFDFAATGGSGGGWTLAAAVASSAIANIDITGLGTPKEILIICPTIPWNTNPATPFFRVSTNNGSSFFSTSGDYKSISAGSGAITASGSIGMVTTVNGGPVALGLHIINNIAGGPKLIHNLIRTDFPSVFFTADNAGVINAVRLGVTAGVWAVGGTIYVFTR